MVSTRTADSKSVRNLLNTKTNILGKLVTICVLCLEDVRRLIYFPSSSLLVLRFSNLVYDGVIVHSFGFIIECSSWRVDSVSRIRAVRAGIVVGESAKAC
jgi:hypothetical protein